MPTKIIYATRHPEWDYDNSCLVDPSQVSRAAEEMHPILSEDLRQMDLEDHACGLVICHSRLARAVNGAEVLQRELQTRSLDSDLRCEDLLGTRDYQSRGEWRTDASKRSISRFVRQLPSGVYILMSHNPAISQFAGLKDELSYAQWRRLEF